MKKETKLEMIIINCRKAQLSTEAILVVDSDRPDANEVALKGQAEWTEC